jgi:hypothetical protein
MAANWRRGRNQLKQGGPSMSLSRRDMHRLVAGATIGLPQFGFGSHVLAQADAATKEAGPMEPLGGQPPAGTKPSTTDFDYQIKHQRAFEAILWCLPAVAIYRFRAAAFDNLGCKDNDIIAYSSTATPKLEAITANSTTPYITAFCNLQRGPTVLEVPAAGPDGSLYGQVVDAWQFTISDIGPSGLDAGKGAKILFTPPGYSGSIPEGYLHVASPNFRIAFALRSVPAQGKTAKDAYAYAQRLRMYFFSEAGNPPKQKFIDPINDRYPTLPFYDERHFDDIHAIVSVEPVRPEDRLMVGMLASLGIRNKGFTFSYDDSIDIDARAAEYFWCTYMPKILGDSPATQYLMALADKNGKKLEAGKLYKVSIPADMPVRQFWALTVYDRATNAFIYTKEGRTTLSSYDLPKMKKNADGGVTLYVGPAAPAGLETNWIPTRGKRPLPAVRFYGPTEALNQKTLKMPDFEPAG